MKKLIALVLSAVMIASLGLIAFAANNITQESDPKKSDVIVRTVIPPNSESYTVQIPADVEIPWGDSDVRDMNPKVTCQLRLGAKLTVTVTDSDSTNTLKYAGRTAGLKYTPTGLGVAYQFKEISNDAIPNDTANTVSVCVPSFAGVPIAVYQTALTYTVDYTAPAP